MPIVGEQRLNKVKGLNSSLAFPAKTTETLKPVEVYSLELGHHGRFFNDKLTTDIKLAHQRFRRLTRADFNPATTTIEYRTGGVATAYNYEMQLDYKPNSKTLFHFGYSWLNLNHQGSTLSNYQESAPHNSLNILASYQLPWRIETSLAYYHRSEMQYIRAATEINQYQRLDFSLRKSFNLSAGQTLELAFIHQNILGAKDEFNSEGRLADRSFIELSYLFD